MRAAVLAMIAGWPCGLAAAGTGLLALPMVASAQVEDPAATIAPVFINDDPTAGESLTQLSSFTSNGQLDQAVRLARELLARHAENIVPSPGDADVHVTVRSRVHGLLLSPAGAALLAAYREQSGVDAEVLLASGTRKDIEQLERSFLLTPPGLEAALRLTEEYTLAGRFALAARTLAQVNDHPDLKGAARTRAADVAKQLWSASGHPAVRVLVQWSGAAPAEAPRTTPRIGARSSLDAAPALTLTDLVPKALLRTQHGQLNPIEVNRFARSSSPLDETLPPYARALRTMPALVGDLAIVVNGRDLVALNTRTLEEAWRVDLVPALHLDRRNENVLRRAPADEFRRMATTDHEDLGLVSAGASGVGIATLTVGEAGYDADIVTGFDAATGRLRWSFSLDQIDPTFEKLAVRGPILIDNDTAVLCCRKSQPERRLSALYLVAVDTFTGAPKWTRLVGSAGQMPYRNNAVVSDGGALHDGVVYRSDRLGVLGAYEAHTGRALWVRRLPPEPVQSEQSSWPWYMNVPVFDEGSLYTISPDRRQVMKIDAQTGALIATAGTEKYADAQYLVKVAGMLALVGENRVAFADFGEFGQAPRLTPALDAPGIRGRVVVSGDRLLVPVLSPASGVLIVDPRRPTREAIRLVRLEEPGNVLPLADRLLVADDAYVLGYLRWDEAEGLLNDESAARPDDPEPRIRLAEFAYAAGRARELEENVGAAGAILARLDPAPDDEAREAREALRARLVRGVLNMLDATLRPRAAVSSVLHSTFEGVDPPALPAEAAGRLLAAIEPLTQGANERATGLLLAAADHERLKRPREAVESLQGVLLDSELRGAALATERSGAAVGIEATKRLQAIVASAGPDVYAAFEAALEQKRAALVQPAPRELEDLARAYPVARAGPSVWLEAARAYAGLNDSRGMTRALEQGLAAADRAPVAPADVIGELAGTLIENLRERGLTTAAAEQLRRVTRTHREAPLVASGKALAAEELAALTKHLEVRERLPALGVPTVASVQTLHGWALAEPLLDDPHGKPAPFLVLTTEDGEVALASPDSEGRAGIALRSRLKLAGEQVFAQLLFSDAEGAVLLVTDFEDSARLVRINVDDPDGSPAWKTESFAAQFQGEGERRRTPTRRPDDVFTPSGVRPSTELIVCADERTIALVQRGGRAVTYDARTGEVLYAGQLEVPRVFTATLSAGVLVVAGQRDVKRVENAPEVEPLLAFVDPRTGESRRLIAQPGGEKGGDIRWLKPTHRGEVIAALSNTIVCYDVLEDGEPAWTLGPATPGAAPTGWLVNDRLVLQDEARSAWMVDATSGAVLSGPIDLRRRLDSQTPVLASRVGTGEDAAIAVRSGYGVVMLSRAGEVVGVDSAQANDDDLLVPVPTRSGFVMLSANRGQMMGGDLGLGYRLYLVDGLSGMIDDFRRLPLPSAPVRVDAIDGYLAITCAHSTIVLSAPAE